MDVDSDSLLSNVASVGSDRSSTSSSSSSASTSSPARVGLSRAVKRKVCFVCGDAAIGFNFNAVSCESCKAFFRRHALKKITGRCNGTCDVTVESRAYCKKCRLQKCLAVGMMPELILNDRQKQVRAQKILQNRTRQNGRNGNGRVRRPDINVTSGEELTHVIASTVDRRVLTELPKWCAESIDELLNAFETTFDAPVEQHPPAAPSVLELLNMADTSIQRLVGMAKKLAHFRQLDQQQQTWLLKGCAAEVLVLRTSKMFNPVSVSWQVCLDGRQCHVSARLLALGSAASQRFVHHYQTFVATLTQSTRRDNILLMLLIVITMFSADHADPPFVHAVSRVQEHYAAVLRQYLDVRYPSQRLMLPRLLQRLTDIRKLSRLYAAMLLDVRPDDLKPLVREIFDLAYPEGG